MSQGLPQTFLSGTGTIPNVSQVVPSAAEFPPQAPEPMGPAWTKPQQDYLNALLQQALTSALQPVFSGASGMQDGNFVVPQSAILSTTAYVGAQKAFTAPRTMTLPTNAPAGFELTWGDEATGSSALNGLNTLTVNTTDGTQIQGGVAGQTGGTNLANTYVANAAAWGPGSTITFMFNGTFWKVK